MSATPNRTVDRDYNIDTNNTRTILNIATHNIKGINCSNKQIHIINFIRNKRINICGFSETNLFLSSASHIYKHDPDYTPYFTAPTTNHIGSGVGILISKQLARHVQKVTSFQGRIIAIDLFLKNKNKLRIIQVYIPVRHQTPDDKKFRKSIDDKLTSILTDARSKSFHIVLMGDFNASQHAIQSRLLVNLLPRPHEQLLHSLPAHGLVDTVNLVHQSLCDNNELTSFTSTTGTSSRIDYIWITHSLIPLLTYANHIQPDLYSSDHLMITNFIDITAIMNLPAAASLRQKSISRKIFIYKDATTENWDNFAT